MTTVLRTLKTSFTERDFFGSPKTEAGLLGVTQLGEISPVRIRTILRDLDLGLTQCAIDPRDKPRHGCDGHSTNDEQDEDEVDGRQYREVDLVIRKLGVFVDLGSTHFAKYKW